VTVRVGVVGGGLVAQAMHLQYLATSGERFRLEAIAEPSRTVREALAARYGIPAAVAGHRELLERGGLDAVVVCSPAATHAEVVLDALEAGLHVFVEKPLCITLADADAIVAARDRTGKVVQVGSQGCTDPKWHRAGELIKQGKLGKIVWSQGSYCRNSTGGEWNYSIAKDASESNIDWAAFLGPAPKRPFDKERFFRWRKYWDYSAGITSDLFPHRLHPLLLALGAEYPTRVVCTGGIYVHKDREVPDTTTMIGQRLVSA